MTIVVETGAGIREANSYVTAAFVTAYLTARGRQTENSWSTSLTQAEFCVAATDYIETRYAHRFGGKREFSFDEVLAIGTIEFAGLPVDTETFALGDITYTFVAALTGVANEILIGVDAAATAANTYAAIIADENYEGSTFGTGTILNRSVTAAIDTATITLTATANGSSGNFTALTGTVTNTTLTVFTGGLDGGPQPLSFPRLYLYDREGYAVTGVPLKLKQATAEYAVRAAAGVPLVSDPSGVGVLREKVGPIEVEYTDLSYSGIVITPYPAADRLLRDYLMSAGGIVRA